MEKEEIELLKILLEEKRRKQNEPEEVVKRIIKAPFKIASDLFDDVFGGWIQPPHKEVLASDMKKKIFICALWIFSLVAVFDFGYKYGGYEGYKTQASYTRFSFLPQAEWNTLPEQQREKLVAEYGRWYELAPKALHQFTPFPNSLLEAIEEVLATKEI